MHRTLLTVLVGALALALVAPASAGETERVKTKVTIRDACLEFGGNNQAFECRAPARARRQYDAKFSGRVKSDEPRCERGRTVKVILVRVAKARGIEPGPIGTTRSDADGRWEFRSTKPGFGEYVAKAKGKRKGNLRCRPDKSRRIDHIPEPD
jgi:hypothetical protein